MSRPSAFLALLLAATWCSAAWHVDLERIGLLFEHKHHADHHEEHEHHHAPLGDQEEHEDVVARDIAKEQVRVWAGPGLWFALIGGLACCLASRLLTLAAPMVRRRRHKTDPPFRQNWQFLRRCAPLSAAPPAWR